MRASPAVARSISACSSSSMSSSSAPARTCSPPPAATPAWLWDALMNTAWASSSCRRVSRCLPPTSSA
eukprot:3570022-Pyramimonas_sp.AAC.1